MQVNRAPTFKTTARGPIKVLFVNPHGCLYGGERGMLEAVQGFDRQRFSLAAICGEEGPLVDELRAAGVPVEVLEMPFMTQHGRAALAFVRGVLPASFRLARYIRQGQFDVVFNNILQNPYGALAARLVGVPCLWYAIETVQNPLLRFAITRVAERLATRLVVISHMVGTMFSKRAQPKIRVVYHGVDSDYFDPHRFDPIKVRRLLSIQPLQPVIGIVGRLHPSKRHHDLLLAMS